jgi:MFS family permease
VDRERYLLSLAALFAFGGRLADIAGHRRMLVIGVVVFAGGSTLCGAALMFPAALAIIVAAFPVADRGKAMAAFFGITGALTAVGPIAGGYLTEWTWRSIFCNLPVAVIALALTAKAKPAEERHPAPIDCPVTYVVAHVAMPRGKAA